MQQLIKQIEQWAEEKNLIEGSTPQKQFLKLAEEIGELITGHNKRNIELIKDAVGDCFVVLAILSSLPQAYERFSRVGFFGVSSKKSWRKTARQSALK